MKTHKTLVLLLGPSGTGKTTLIRELRTLFPLSYDYPRPYTTRELRENETDKIHVDRECFSELANSGVIVCPNEVHGNFYGPTREEIHRILSSYRKPLLDWPIDRIDCLNESLPEVRKYSVYVLPPDLQTLKSRLSTDDRDGDGKRYAAAVQELNKVQKGEYQPSINLFFQNEGEVRKNVHRLHFLLSTCIDEKVEPVSTKNGDEKMDPKEFKLKNDKYRTARGGEAHLLDISCTKCNSSVIKYQKDGKGDLIRCYLNRIFYPPEFEKLQHDVSLRTTKDVPKLACLSCTALIGIPMLYADGRLAYRLIPGTFAKKRLF